VRFLPVLRGLFILILAVVHVASDNFKRETLYCFIFFIEKSCTDAVMSSKVNISFNSQLYFRFKNCCTSTKNFTFS
jgi:hypothetical protein